MRVACALGLIALAALLAMIVETEGRTAVAFAFLGIPAFALSVVVYLAAARSDLREALAQVLRRDGGEPNGSRASNEQAR